MRSYEKLMGFNYNLGKVEAMARTSTDDPKTLEVTYRRRYLALTDTFLAKVKRERGGRESELQVAQQQLQELSREKQQADVVLRARDGEIAKLKERLNRQIDKDLERASQASKTHGYGEMPYPYP